MPSQCSLLSLWKKPGLESDSALAPLCCLGTAVFAAVRMGAKRLHMPWAGTQEKPQFLPSLLPAAQSPTHAGPKTFLSSLSSHRAAFRSGSTRMPMANLAGIKLPVWADTLGIGSTVDV